MVNNRSSISSGWYKFSLFVLLVGCGLKYHPSSAFQLIIPVPTTAVLSSNNRMRRNLKLNSCPVMELTRPSNDTMILARTNNVQVKQGEEKSTKEFATLTTPKLLGRSSGFKFVVASLRGKPHKYLARLQKKHGDNFIIRPNIVVLNDPKAIRDVLETHNLPKTPKVRYGYKSIFYGTKTRSSGGILAAPWNKWLEQRRMAAPALAESVIGSLAPKIFGVSAPFFDYLETKANNNQRVDMSAAFTAVTMDVIGKVLLGKSFGMCRRLSLEEKKNAEVPFATALHRLTDEAIRQMVLPGWWLRRRPKLGEVENARKVIDDFLEDCIETRIADHKEGKETTDLLNILLEAETNGAMSHDEVKGQLLQFVFAGFDTLAPTLSYMLWEISQNPKLQDELAAEAKLALPGKYDLPWSPDILARQLPLMDKTFLETNRKHPAAAMGTSRNVGRKSLIVGDGIKLPKQSSVLIPPWTLHRNERFYPDSETFDPSRFDTALQDPYAYQPFSGGPRNCIGSRLARAEALSLFAPLLRRYEFQSKSRREPDDHFSLTRRPRKEVMFTLTPRPE